MCILTNYQESALPKLSSLCLIKSVQIRVILRHFLVKNGECASYRVDGIMRRVYPLNLLGECIVKVQFIVPHQECVNPCFTPPFLWQ